MLRDDIIIAEDFSRENTAVAAPAGEPAKLGRIVICTGQPSPGLVPSDPIDIPLASFPARGREGPVLLTRPLQTPSGEVDISPDSTQSMIFNGVPGGGGLLVGNRSVRLPDGSLLILKNGCVWSPLPNAPSWADERITDGPFTAPGNRGADLFFRSTDGGATWLFYSMIDYAPDLGGSHGSPRPMVSQDPTSNEDPGPDRRLQFQFPDGGWRWWAGDGHGEFLYVCPFTKRLYLTVIATGGDMGCDPSPSRPFVEEQLLLVSGDMGKTWQVNPHIRFPVTRPLVMTSTPDGRLFLFHVDGGHPVVYYSDIDRQCLTPAIHGPYVVRNSAGTPYNSDLAHDPNTRADPGIARISIDHSSSSVRVLFPTTSAYEIAVPGARAQITVVRVDVTTPGRSPSFRELGHLHPLFPYHSICRPTVVETDSVNQVTRTAVNTCVVYWIEVPPQKSPNLLCLTSYAELTNDDVPASASPLSFAGGRPREWQILNPLTYDPGDYMGGAFYEHNGALNFLCQWPEETSIRANIVSVPHRFAPEGSMASSASAQS